MPSSVVRDKMRHAGRSIGGSPYYSYRKEYPEVYDFYKDIAPAIRKRQLGVDELPPEERKAFEEVLDVPLDYEPFLYGQNGYYSGWRQWLPKWFLPRMMLPNDHVNIAKPADKYQKSDAPRIVAHELRHALERRIPTAKGQYDKLNKVWGFRGVDIMPLVPMYSKALGEEEMATTNKEHQFEMYRELRGLLGRAPSAEEYFKYVKGLDRSQLEAKRGWHHQNYYQIEADRKRWMDEKKEMEEDVDKIPFSYTHKGGTPFPSWIDFAPHVRSRLEDVKDDSQIEVLPRNDEWDGRKADDAERYRDAMMNISKATKWNPTMAANDKSRA